MKELIEYLIKQVVDKPEEVRIHEVTGQQTIVLELHVGSGDLGKVIGRHGQTASSLRTLLTAGAAKKINAIFWRYWKIRRINKAEIHKTPSP